MRELILKQVDDIVAKFLYYDRKEDEDLPLEAIEKAIYAGEITVKDITDRFAYKFTEAIITDH